MIVGGIWVCRILWMSWCRWTVSKAFDISRAIATVRFGGCFWLKPVVIILLIWWSAVVVERCCLNPCWWCGRSMFCAMYGRIIFSSILASGERSAIGRSGLLVFLKKPITNGFFKNPQKKNCFFMFFFLFFFGFNWFLLILLCFPYI